MESRKGSTQAHAKRTRTFRSLLAVLYLGALGLLIVWEYHERLEAFSSECSLRDEAKPSLYNRPYSRFLSWTSSDTPGHVVSVAIPSDLEDIQSNVCLGRSYLADVLRTIGPQRPGVVVLDKFYGPSACAGEPQRTQELMDAVKGVGVPVVIGESTRGLDEAVASSCLVRRPQLDFAAQNVTHGLTRLNVEVERLPLRWLVLPKMPEEHGPAEETAEFADSLALVAAKAYDPQFVAQRSVQRLIERDDHAYANLDVDIPRVTTEELLCASGDAAVRTRWSLYCERHRELPRLLGKVVVIGAEDSSDLKTVLGHHMWGFELQARYIESLLSGDYLKSLPISFSFVLFAVFVLLIEGVPTILQVYRPRWKKKMILSHAYPRRRYVWVIFGTVAVIVVSAAGALALRYLPPLVVYGDILLVAVTRLFYFSAESLEHPLLHAHHHSTRKEHTMSNHDPLPDEDMPENDEDEVPTKSTTRVARPSSTNRPGSEGGTNG